MLYVIILFKMFVAHHAGGGRPPHVSLFVFYSTNCNHPRLESCHICGKLMTPSVMTTVNTTTSKDPVL